MQSVIKASLNQEIVRKLTIEHKPKGIDDKGKLVFMPNLEGERYTILDASQDSPSGFGIRVGLTKKVYFIQKRVGQKVVKTTIGNCSDMTLAVARERAMKTSLTIKDTGVNPNSLARIAAKQEKSLMFGAILKNHRQHMVTRTVRPATPATLKVLDRIYRKFESIGWTDKPLSEISTDAIMEQFREWNYAPTANEQNFRWASQAVQWTISNETLAAAAEKRSPIIFANPFEILYLNGMYRTTMQVERSRSLSGKRNPLKPSETLGPFLEAAWSKKNTNNNETGVYYLLCMLLWGCRKSEHAECMWGDALTEKERKQTSHVWLGEKGEGPYVFFYDTKNGLDHRIPIGPLTAEMLRRHQRNLAEYVAKVGFGSNKRKWVFPAKNKYSKTGHYSDSKELLDRIRDEAGIPVLTRHDLRRSFGSVMISINVPEGMQKRLFNHKSRGEGVTRIYTQAEWSLMKEWVDRIEQAMLTKAPNIYNSLKPTDWPPLPAPEPHVCKPPKPRTGRPRKAMLEAMAGANVESPENDGEDDRWEE